MHSLVELQIIRKCTVPLLRYSIYVESLNQLHPYTVPNECIRHTIKNENITQYLAKLILIIDFVSVKWHVARFCGEWNNGF